jgi:hypothetical protein
MMMVDKKQVQYRRGWCRGEDRVLLNGLPAFLFWMPFLVPVFGPSPVPGQPVAPDNLWSIWRRYATIC